MSPPRSSIEADSSDHTDDSDLSKLEFLYDDAADSASLAPTMASQVNRYKYINGRRYHSYKAGSWPVPNDEKQQDQMDIFHEIYTRAKGGELFVSPLEGTPTRILDLGCGTGIWTMQCADRYPNTEVIGNDLSPIQPNWVPPNCVFEVDDFNDPWTYRPSTFDLVNARALHVAVANWRAFCKEAFKALKPGGWFEVCSELCQFGCDDGTFPPDSPIHDWISNIRAAVARMGRDIENHHILEECMADAGFDMSTYSQTIVKAPVGTWPRDRKAKELGALNLCNILSCMEGVSLSLYTETLGWPLDAFQAHLEDLLRAFKNKKSHIYIRIHTTYAQKPKDY